MNGGLYRPDPLPPGQRAEHEDDLILFCDRELDRMGDLRGLRVLYAGGAAPLWLEGLLERLGGEGSLTALETDPERLERARETLGPDAPVGLVRGDVFDPPLPEESFDLVYSAGLLHELDVRGRGADDAIAALVRLVRPGGRVAASDFVLTEGASPVQVEDERLDREDARLRTGAELYGIGPPGRLIRLFRRHLRRVRWELAPPFPIRHLDRLVLAGMDAAEDTSVERAALRRRILAEGYTRPATLYVEGERGP